MRKEITKVRVRSSQIYVPGNSDETLMPYPRPPLKKEDKALRIKHLDTPCEFTEDAPLYDLVIADYDEANYRVLRFKGKNGKSFFFNPKEKIGLISKKTVDLLFLSNI